MILNVRQEYTSWTPDQDFDWSLRTGDASNQIAILGDCRKLHGFKAESYLRMAGLCRQGGGKHAASQKECLAAALRLLTNNMPIQDFSMVAHV